MILPKINVKRVTEVIVKRLKWYVFDYAKMRSGIVGVSGGIDSAVTAFLTARALGVENTYCYILPSDATPQEDLEDALSVIRSIGLPDSNWEIIHIGKIIETFKKALGEMTRKEIGNIMARTRMIILHQRAARNKGLVIGTGDKSELLIGYFTKFGDGGVDLLPIGGLYKTHVRQLAEYLGVPRRIIEKPPSPRLWPGQTAEGEIGLSYEIIDDILYLRFEEWVPEDEIASILKVRKEDVEKIIGMVKRTQHKRLPPEVFHISFRDIGSDWRYPRQWF